MISVQRVIVVGNPGEVHSLVKTDFASSSGISVRNAPCGKVASRSRGLPGVLPRLDEELHLILCLLVSVLSAFCKSKLNTARK